MSLYDYRVGQRIDAECFPFYALVQAALRRADTRNGELLRAAFPEVAAELDARYNAPGGILWGDGEQIAAVVVRGES